MNLKKLFLFAGVIAFFAVGAVFVTAFLPAGSSPPYGKDAWAVSDYRWNCSGYEFSIGMRTAPDPFRWSDPDPELAVNPVLTGEDVTDMPAAFVADPFMIPHDGKWYMFVEVLDASVNRGVISLAVSEDGLDWEYKQEVLREPFHLSYPHVFEHEGAHYMIVESYQDNSVRLYRADPFPDGWRFKKRILEGEHVDNSIFRHGDRWWMMTGIRANNRLRLYHAPEKTGPWEEHPESPLVENDPHTARPGGRVIPYEGELIRYPQDCYPRYGNAVHAFIIEKLTEEEYEERAWEHNPILDGSGEGWNSLGMHHIDPYELEDGSWLAVVDGYDHPQPDHRVGIDFESGERFLGFSVRPRAPSPGDRVLLRFFWKDVPDYAGQNPPAMFVHFTRDNFPGFLPGGRGISFQADYKLSPGRESYYQVIEIPEDASPGRYLVRVGLYDTESGRREEMSTDLPERRRSAVLPVEFEVRPSP